MLDVKIAQPSTPSCPTCGGVLPETKLVVDLNTNVVVLGSHRIKLRPRDAEVMAVLQEYYPRSVSESRIEDRVLGNESGERCREWVRVRISMLRKKLAGLPIHIANTHGVGYRIVMAPVPDEKPDSFGNFRKNGWAENDKAYVIDKWNSSLTTREIASHLNRTVNTVWSYGFGVLKLGSRKDARRHA